MIKLSIVVPIYNAEEFLPTFMNSVVEQINDNVELILVDDGSTDDSLKIIQRYKKEHPNIFVKTIKNQGSGVARNNGIEMARGEYIYFADADDIIYDSAVKDIISEIEGNYDFIVFSYTQSLRDGSKMEKQIMSRITLDGEVVRKSYYKYMYLSDHYLQGAPWNKIFKRELLIENNVRFPSLRRGQDVAFVISYTSYVKTIQLSPKIIYHYYLNTPKDESLKFPKDYFDIRKSLFNIFDYHLKSWDSSSEYIVLQDFNFIISLSTALMLIYTENWEMNKYERDLFIKEIIEDKLVVERVSYLKNNIQEVFDFFNMNIIRKLYYKLFIDLIYNKNIVLLKIFAKIRFYRRSFL